MAEDAGADAEPVAEQSTRSPLPRSPRRPSRLPRGTCIGRYVVIDVLGAGGMGVVYRAYDPELDRRIALKLVRDGRSEPSRLVAEAQALARVSHPNVVQVYDVGTVGEQVFIAMELVEGQTVHAWRAVAKPTRRHLLDVFLAAGRGLAAAHKAGIVHRDFKPSNVIIGDDGRVRVADFGLARAGELVSSSERTPTPSGAAGAGIPTSRSTPRERPRGAAAATAQVPAPAPILTAGETESQATPMTLDVGELDAGAVAGAFDGALRSLGRPIESRDVNPFAGDTDNDFLDAPDAATASGAELDSATSVPRILASRVMGTPSYMAPEQRRAGVYDARVDQYAFAVALYETLYGERPFDGATGAELASNALAEKFRAAPKGTTVPAHLRRTLLRALSAQPEQRFPSMEALLDELADDPIARRRRRLAAAGVLAVIALVIFLVARSRAGAGDPCADAGEHLRGAWDPDVAARVERALRATGRPYATAVATRTVAELGARADEWTGLRRKACLAHVRGEVSAELYDREQVCLDRRARELGALTTELGRNSDAARLDHALDAVAALPSIAACADRDALLAIPLPADAAARAKIAALRDQLAHIDAQVSTGQYAAAIDRAVAVSKAAVATGYAPVAAEALLSAGRAAGGITDFARAESYFYDAAAHAAAARDDALAGEIWVELFRTVGYDLGRTDQARPLERAAGAAVARAGAAPELRARFLDAEALVASHTDDLDAAIAREREALALREERSDELATAESVNDLALLTSQRGDYPGALALHKRALAMRQKALGDAHPLVADSLDNIGVILYHLGQLAEARGYYERALALRTAAFGPDARDVGTTLNNLGGLYTDLGDDARAQDYLERALATWEKALGPQHPDLAIPLTNLADLANKHGAHDRARDLCKRALAIDEKAHGHDAPDLAYDLVCLGESELALPDPGDARAAVVDLDRALTLRTRTPGDAGELARTRFDLARALAATGGDLARARRLASDACQAFDMLGGTWTARRDQCNAWLAAHR